eukprot:TRINITY_DN8051_c0_g1_i2.p1 TRINITY_DN8051_c0_g1~~TRINITY_DN8051_c0_g1_i2.p1  ORF type:complete len:129 (-),score=3.06 TRINITY_DN8051_c0_g1_i2:212-598(-)
MYCSSHIALFLPRNIILALLRQIQYRQIVLRGDYCTKAAKSSEITQRCLNFCKIEVIKQLQLVEVNVRSYSEYQNFTPISNKPNMEYFVLRNSDLNSVRSAQVLECIELAHSSGSKFAKGPLDTTTGS